MHEILFIIGRLILSNIIIAYKSHCEWAMEKLWMKIKKYYDYEQQNKQKRLNIIVM